MDINKRYDINNDLHHRYSCKDYIYYLSFILFPYSWGVLLTDYVYRQIFAIR
jgi:hypothetical protein